MSRDTSVTCTYCRKRAPLSGNKCCLQCINKSIRETGVGKIVSGSRGEQMLRKTLDHLLIKYKTEHIFEDLRMHRYDFYVPEFKLVIEYDGEAHFTPIPRYHKKVGSFEKQQLADTNKTLYIKNKPDHILLRIDYTWLSRPQAVEDVLRCCLISQKIFTTQLTSNLIAMSTEMYSYMHLEEALVSINSLVMFISNSTEYKSFVKMLPNNSCHSLDASIEYTCLTKYQPGYSAHALSRAIMVSLEYSNVVYSTNNCWISGFYTFLFRNPGLATIEMALISLGYTRDLQFLIDYIEPGISVDGRINHFSLPHHKLVIQLDDIQELSYISSPNLEDKDYQEYRAKNLLDAIDVIFCRNYRLLRIAYDRESKDQHQWIIKSMSMVIRYIILDNDPDTILFLTHGSPYSTLIRILSMAITDLKLVRDEKFMHGYKYENFRGVVVNTIEDPEQGVLISKKDFLLPNPKIIDTYQPKEPIKSVISAILMRAQLKPNSSLKVVDSSVTSNPLTPRGSRLVIDPNSALVNSADHIMDDDNKSSQDALTDWNLRAPKSRDNDVIQHKISKSIKLVIRKPVERHENVAS